MTAKPSMRVLMVENEADHELLLRRLLRQTPSQQCEVHCVRSYAEAAEALRQPFDICLMDYHLGLENTLDLLRSVDVSALPGPVVLLTSHSSIEVEQAALDLGVADFIAKSELTAPLLDRTIRYCSRQFHDRQQLSHIARHDALTGLLNRRTFLSLLEHWLHAGIYGRDDIYVLYLDVDRFKTINDTWGHDVGDRILRHVSNSLRNVLSQADLAARYGGDEFIAAVAHVERSDIDAFAEKLLRALRQPLVIDGRALVTHCSVGIARASQTNGSVGDILRMADHALLAAKGAGRDTYRLFSPDMQLRAHDRSGLEADLRRALAEGSIFMAFQPQIDTETGRIVGAEALARWSHPLRGTVPPAEFVHVAEDCGLIHPLVYYTLDHSLSALHEWMRKGLISEHFRLGVNLSTITLLDPEFCQRLSEIMDRHPGVAGHLRLELAESALLKERTGSGKRFEELKAMGVSLALANFGAGSSPLAPLGRLPIDTLKIDAGFGSAILQSERTSALIRFVLSLGQELRLDVIVEGVESEDHWRLLRTFGCRTAQGRWCGEAMAAREFVEVLETGGMESTGSAAEDEPAGRRLRMR